MSHLKKFITGSHDKNAAGAKTIFIALLYALFLVLVITAAWPLSLHSFNGREIGEGAFRNIDISERVRLFYFALLLFACLAFAFRKVLNRLHALFNEKEINILSYSSLAGLFLLLLSLYSEKLTGNIRQLPGISGLFNMFPSFTLLAGLHLSVYAGVAVSRLVNPKESSLSYEHYALFFILSFNLFFLAAALPLKINHSIFIAITSSLLPLIFQMAEYKTGTPMFFRKMCTTCRPLAFLPLLFIAADELSIIFNARGIPGVTPGIIFLGGLLVIIAFMARGMLRMPTLLPEPNNLLSKFYFPMMAAGMLLFAFYNPAARPSPDLFEKANTILPIQQFYEYGKLPLAETFNSHLFSDHFWSFIYTFINGYDHSDPFSMELYNFMDMILWGVLVYYFLLSFTSTHYAALFILLFIPFTPALFPENQTIVLVSLFACVRLIRSQSVFNYSLWVSSILFFILWRADLGLANLAASPVTVIAGFYVSKTNINLKNLRRAILGILLILILAGTAITLYSHVKFFNVLRDITSHLSASQAYGYKALASQYDSFFLLQYFLFPAVVVVIAGIVLYKYASLAENRQLHFVATALIFLCFFYLFNFHRGLVRHGFVEGMDRELSSFVFLIFSGSIFLFTGRDLNPVRKTGIFLLSAYVMIYLYKYPKQDLTAYSSLYDRYAGKTESYVPLSSGGNKICRCSVSNEFRDSAYGELESFLSSVLKKDETFIDFSNSPMLYFYTHRKEPSFFIQIPSMLHNDYLQNRFLKNLKKEKVPVVIFSGIPETWYDHMDEVPNAVRHYRIAEYIYTNYHPFAVIDKRAVWVENTFHPPDTPVMQRDEYSGSPRSYDLMDLPFIWGTYDSRISTCRVLSVPAALPVTTGMDIAQYPVDTVIDKSSGNYLLLEISSGNSIDIPVALRYGKGEKTNGEFLFLIHPSANPLKYAIRLSTQYNWMRLENEWISIAASPGSHPHGKTSVLSAALLKGD